MFVFLQYGRICEFLTAMELSLAQSMKHRWALGSILQTGLPAVYGFIGTVRWTLLKHLQHQSNVRLIPVLLYLHSGRQGSVPGPTMFKWAGLLLSYCFFPKLVVVSALGWVINYYSVNTDLHFKNFQNTAYFRPLTVPLVVLSTPRRRVKKVVVC